MDTKVTHRLIRVARAFLRKASRVFVALFWIAVVFIARSSAEITVRVSTDQISYVLGEPILITVSAVNSSDEPVRFVFPTSHQSDYVLNGVMLPGLWTQAFTSVTVPANGAYDWARYHFAGESPLNLGRNEVVGRVVTYPPRVSESVSFEIVAPDPVVDDVFIDFESFPDGTPIRLPDGRVPTGYSSQAFAAWGVTFRTDGFRLGYFNFSELGTNNVLHATSVNGPWNIIADFAMPVFSVSADVGAEDGHSVTLSAFDAAGNLLGTAISDPTIDFPHLVGPLEFTSDSPIASVKWTASDPLSTVRIDNLRLDVVAVPEPATMVLTVVAVAGLLSTRRFGRWRRRSTSAGSLANPAIKVNSHGN